MVVFTPLTLIMIGFDTHPNDSQSSVLGFLILSHGPMSWRIWRELSIKKHPYIDFTKRLKKGQKGSAPRKKFAADWIFSWFRNALEAILGIILSCQILEEIILGLCPFFKGQALKFPHETRTTPDISGWETMASTSSRAWSPNPCAMLPTRTKRASGSS